MAQPCAILHEESALTGSIIPLLPGPAICPTYIHYRLLCARSPYFARLLASWSGRTDDAVRLDNTEPEVFEQFAAWLYTDCVAVPRGKEGAWRVLCGVWVLGGEVPALQNKAVEAIAHRLYDQDFSSLNLDVLVYVYDKTSPQSLLRKLFVHICVWYGNEEGFAELTKELPTEFHTDYAVQRAWRGRVEEGSEGEKVEGWDLRRFWVEEKEREEVRVKKEVKVKEERRDSVTEEPEQCDRVQCATQ